MPDSRRLARLLVGTGLVLVGLLSGILVMLVVDDSDPPPVTRVVERVKVGQQSASQASQVDSAMRADGGPSPAALNQLFRTVAERVTGAVVSIQVRPEGGQSREMTEEDLFGPSPRQSVGSGVLISPDGYIVTNHHVVQQEGTIQVTMADKRRFEGELVGSNEATDIAVVKINGSADFPVIPIGDSDQIEVGDWVVAVGNPFQLTSTVTAGIVSALGRQINVIQDQFRIENFIQTDAAINPGNSGGALVNMDGELVGINTAIASGSGTYEGYGFAIPSDLVERITRDLIAYGEVRRGYLGVSIQEMNARVAEDVGLDNIRGVYVQEVQEGSAAARAGIQGGDVVVGIDGRAVDSPNELQSTVVQKRPGDVVSVRVWRDGTERTYNVRLMGEDTPVYQDWLGDIRSEPEPGPVPEAQRPGEDKQPGASDAPVVELPEWSVGLRGVGESIASRFGIEDGAYVAYVENGGAAADAGLPRDVVITALDDTSVEGPDDVKSYIEEASGAVLVEVQRPDGTLAFYEVE